MATIFEKSDPISKQHIAFQKFPCPSYQGLSQCLKGKAMNGPSMKFGSSDCVVKIQALTEEIKDPL